MIQVIIALLVIVAVARLILRGYKAEPVLLVAGLLLMFCTQLAGWGSVLPKGVATTGIALLDPFEVMRDLFSTRAADLGLMIMALMGFAHYMDHIGANEAVVRVVTRPLRRLQSPYTLLFFSYLLASLLQLAIPSATGLAVLLMGTMFPIMLGLGLSAASAAGVIATSLGVAYTPTAIDAIRGAKAVDMDVVEYVLYHQGLRRWRQCWWWGSAMFSGSVTAIGAPVRCRRRRYSSRRIRPRAPCLLCAAADAADSDGGRLLQAVCQRDQPEYRHHRDDCHGSLHADRAAASARLQVGMRRVQPLSERDGAGVYRRGRTVGGRRGLCAWHQGDRCHRPADPAGRTRRAAPFAMAIVFALVTFAAAIIMGSGNAPFLAFVELIPQIASSMGANAVAMILPMQQASHMGRALSPVSGVVIAVSSGARLSPFEVVRRTSVPLIVGFIFHTALIGLFY